MHVFRFHEFGLKTPIKAPKLGVLGDLTAQLGLPHREPPKGTNDYRNTSYEPLSFKIALKVWPVGVAKNG